MLISLKYGLLLVSLVAGIVTVNAQKLPIPGEKNPEWVLRELSKAEQHEVYSYRLDANVRQTMPVMKVYGDHKNPETGEIISFMDHKNEVWYDISKGVLYDFQNSKTYQFYKKGEKPKPPVPAPKH